MQQHTETYTRPAAQDVRQPRQNRAAEPEHDHRGVGARISAATAAPDRMHAHRTSLGMTDLAQNRPGHRHRLPDGSWSNPAIERWSNARVGRM